MRLRFMYMPNPYVIAFSGKSIPVASGVGPSVSMTCQTAKASGSHQQPKRDVVPPILQAYGRGIQHL